MKIVNDTFKSPSGKWSRKSLTAFASFWLGIAYESIGLFTSLQTKEYVFVTLMGLAGGILGATVFDKYYNQPQS